jgi:hypothetical protein
MQNRVRAIRVDFSLRREVFFVVVGAIVGALIIVYKLGHNSTQAIMHVPPAKNG